MPKSKNKSDLSTSSFLCDVCGKENTGEKHRMYDENWIFLGCYECADCFDEKMRGIIGE